MKNVQKIDLGLTGYDELFMNDAERKENKLPRIYDVPISEIDDFPDHPFKVKIDEDMDQLVQSIKERGIITPVTLRPKDDGRYEIVSGHRRKKACELAGLDTVKAEVREMTRDEAIILMVESNLQRSTILPSEKAFSYKMRLEAMNRQGERADLTCSPMDNKLKGVKSASLLKEATGDGQAQVYRYIRLTELKKKAICEYLRKNHIGKGNAIHSKELEKLFMLDGRNIRRKISSLRQDGFPICSDESGYYYADNQKEINNTVCRLNELVTKVSNARTGLLFASILGENEQTIEVTIKVR